MSDILFVKRNIRALSILGLWNYGESKQTFSRILFNFYGKTVFYFFILFNTTQFIEMYYIRNNVLGLMGNVAISLLYCVTSLKAYTMHFRKDRIRYLLDEVRKSENYALRQTTKEKDIYEDSLNQNTFVTNLFWYVCASTISLFYIARPAEFYLLGPQEMHGFKVPFVFSSWFPYDKFAKGYYEFSYTFQVIMSSIGSSYIAVIDVFLVSFLIFSVGQFRILQYSIRHLHHHADYCKRDKNNLIDTYYYAVDIIKKHNVLIEFLVDFDNLISPIIFVNFLTCSLMICSVGLEGIMAGPSPRLGLNLYYLIAILIQLLMFYWHANEVSIESMKIGQAVTESQWYNFTPKVKHALLMMLVRSQKPSTLSVGGFYNMSLNTFLMILRAAYTFLALFRQVYARQIENSIKL